MTAAKGDILSSIAEQFLPQMTPAERRAAIESLQRIIDEERFKLATDGADSPCACPRCGCERSVKRGRDSAGRQRHKCKGCGATFTAASGGVLSNSKLQDATWQRFAACFVDRLPLRECAQRCQVSLKTAWFMRHRVLEALWKHMPRFQVQEGCGAVLDEAFFNENFKGNHTRSAGFKMPRKARHRGRENHTRGISHDLICVLTGVNDAGDIFFDVACRGKLSRETAYSLLEGRVEEGSIVSTDKLQSYVPALRELGVACHNAFDSKTQKGPLNPVNTLHSLIEGFMAPFKGISTRRLEKYLAWFKWDRSFRRGKTAADTAEVALRQLAGGTYETTWRKCKDTPYPFFEYWESQGAA